MSLKSLAVLAAGASLLALPASAHHSFAMFDMTKSTALEGAVVKEVHWSNPHVWIDFTVPKAGGGSEVWGVETGATNTLLRHGWKRDILKPGDKVTAFTVRPMRNGTAAGSLVALTTPDGKVLTNGAQGKKVEE